jgi:signal peptidase II
MPTAGSDPGAAAEGGSEVDGPRRRRPHLPIVFGVAAVVIAVDQLSKWWALENLDDGMIEVVWTLRFNLVFNRGASFSLGDGFGPLIGVLALGVVGVLLWTGRTVKSVWGAVALGLVLGGALGNLIDRAFRSTDGFMGGAVIDFIDLQWWPVWNVADAGVVVGAILLLVVSYRQGL